MADITKPVSEVSVGDWFVPPREYLEVADVVPTPHGYTIISAAGKYFFFASDADVTVKSDFSDGQFGVGPFN